MANTHEAPTLIVEKEQQDKKSSAKKIKLVKPVQEEREIIDLSTAEGKVLQKKLSLGSLEMQSLKLVLKRKEFLNGKDLNNLKESEKFFLDSVDNRIRETKEKIRLENKEMQRLFHQLSSKEQANVIKRLKRIYKQNRKSKAV